MTSSHSASFFYISLRANYLGKVYPPEPKKKNMKKLEIKNYPHKLNSYAKACLKKLACTSATADHSNLKRNQISDIYVNSSKIYSIGKVTNMTTFSTGWSKSLQFQPKLHSRAKKRSKMKATSQSQRTILINELINST